MDEFGRIAKIVLPPSI
ncbi:hypothetical protein AYI68_g7074, partial [Smittium mucronatum]